MLILDLKGQIYALVLSLWNLFIGIIEYDDKISQYQGKGLENRDKDSCFSVWYYVKVVTAMPHVVTFVIEDGWTIQR